MSKGSRCEWCGNHHKGSFSFVRVTIRLSEFKLVMCKSCVDGLVGNPQWEGLLKIKNIATDEWHDP